MRIGIDVGGTKTHLALERDGQVEHRVVPTSEWQRGGLFGDGSVDRLLALVRPAVAEPARTPLAIGAHGCDSAAQVATFDRQVRDRWPGPVWVANDAELLAPAYGVEHAICLIVGTGSIVIGKTAEGEPVYVGGHGWLIDDYGSAPGLTREAVRAVVTARDEARPRDGLAERLMAHFGAGDEVELSITLTTTRANIAAWAEPARLVFEAAADGSATAAAVVDDAAERLARQLVLVRARGALGDTVVAAGGVVSHQPRLLDAIARHLAVLDDSLALRLLEVQPVAGALEMARRIEPGPPRQPTFVTDTTGGTR